VALERLHADHFAARVFSGAPKARLELLRALWPGAVGPEVARRSEVVGLEDGVLRVRVADARWKKALFRVHRDILVRLRRSAGPLAPGRLGFIEGAVAERPAPAEAPEAKPATLLPETMRAAENIADEETRRRFLESAALYLGRTRS
jgi:hypothetical protein